MAIWWIRFTRCLYIGGPAAQADGLGPKVGGHLVPFLYSSCEPSELSQWLCHDDSTINIAVVLLLLLFLFFYFFLIIIIIIIITITIIIIKYNVITTVHANLCRCQFPCLESPVGSFNGVIHIIPSHIRDVSNDCAIGRIDNCTSSAHAMMQCTVLKTV